MRRRDGAGLLCCGGGGSSGSSRRRSRRSRRRSLLIHLIIWGAACVRFATGVRVEEAAVQDSRQDGDDLLDSRLLVLQSLTDCVASVYNSAGLDSCLDAAGMEPSVAQGWLSLAGIIPTAVWWPALSTVGISVLSIAQSALNTRGIELAEALLRLAKDLNPEDPMSLHNWGLAREALGDLPGAILLYERALEAYPGHGNARLSLGKALLMSQQSERAEKVYEGIVECEDVSINAKLLYMLGTTRLHFLDPSNPMGAEEAFDASLSTGYTHPPALFGSLFTRRRTCNYQGWESLVSTMLVVAEQSLSPSFSVDDAINPYDLLLAPDADSSLLRMAAARICEVLKNDILPPRLVRVGVPAAVPVVYLSRDWRDHVMARLTAGFILNQSRGPRLHVIAASYGPPVESSPERKRLQAEVNTWLDLFGVESRAAAEAIWAQSPAILVDLMGHTTGRNLALSAMKPAPIVVNYLGYPGTMGAIADYALLDPVVVPPESSSAWSERMIYLPETYQANDCSVHTTLCSEASQPNFVECMDRVRSASGIKKSLESYGGSSAKGPVLCNYNNADKLDPSNLDFMMSVLRRIPGSILVLLTASDGVTQVAQAAALWNEAAVRGIDPRRLVLHARVDANDHANRVTGCDVMLDSLTYGAHTTATDMLWAGVPLVTTAGYGREDHFPSGKMQARVGASLLEGLGLPETATRSLKEAEDWAVALGRGSVARALRRRIQQLSLEAPLFDTERISRTIEDALEAVWEVREHGLMPQNIVVGKSSRKMEFTAFSKAVRELEVAQQVGLSTAEYVSGRIIMARN
jgi:protein O-GlcNAc transferase